MRELFSKFETYVETYCGSTFNAENNRPDYFFDINQTFFKTNYADATYALIAFFENPNYAENMYLYNPYCFIFWNIEDIVSYVSDFAMVGIKFVLNIVGEIFDNTLIAFLYQNYWYMHMLSGSPASRESDVFEISMVGDLITLAKNIKSHFYVSLDVMPATGLLFPYLLEHPEVCAYLNRYENTYFFTCTSSLYTAFFNSKIYYVVDTAVVLFGNFSILFLVWFYLKVFFFSYFITLFSDANNNDTDHTVSTLLTESEKEISGIDDLIIIFLILFFIFGIYFLFYGVAQLSSYFNNYVCIYFIIPFLFYFMYVAPVCLLFDFGIYLFVYLRGSGPTAMLAAELLYDLINTFAYFIRVFIQLARLLLMLIAAGSLQEFIFYFGVDYTFLMCNDSFLDCCYNIEFNLKSLTLFFFTKLPFFILYWIYEIFHTYFVVTIQTIAFFAMVFWLFFYLFTFFFSESHEAYLKKKRIFYKKILAPYIKQ